MLVPPVLIGRGGLVRPQIHHRGSVLIRAASNPQLPLTVFSPAIDLVVVKDGARVLIPSTDFHSGITIHGHGDGGALIRRGSVPQPSTAALPPAPDLVVVVRMAHVCSNPALTALASFASAEVDMPWGFRSVVVPRPSCPEPFSPQHPSPLIPKCLKMAQACLEPVLKVLVTTTVTEIAVGVS